MMHQATARAGATGSACTLTPPPCLRPAALLPCCPVAHRTGNKAKECYALGAEGAGVVAAVGPGVTSLAVGQAVACNSAAAFAEYGVTAATSCTPIPAASPEAVALVLSATTAAAALEGTARVASGETVVVTAAAGGTGQYAVQLAALAGAHVVAVVGSQHKAAAVEALGAHRVIDYNSEV